MQEPLRLHSMDSMRSVLMMLGILLHTANIFSTNQLWLISSENSSSYADLISASIHTFRMPAFFVISGFFSVLLIHRYGLLKFFIQRIERILIPLVVTALTFNSAQSFLLDYYGYSTFNLAQYLQDGAWVSHLWFLVNLIFYYLILLALFKPVNRYVKGCVQFIEKLPFFMVAFIFLPAMQILVLSLNKLGFPLYESYFGFINVYSIAQYLPYFLFGLILFESKPMLACFSQYHPALLLMLIVACVAIEWHWLSGQTGITLAVASTYVSALKVCLSVSLCFYVFFKWFSHKNKFMSFGSEASYTIYLSHHLLVIAFGLIAITLNLSPLLGTLMVSAAVFASSLLLHILFVSRYSSLRYLFNGKR